MSSVTAVKTSIPVWFSGLMIERTGERTGATTPPTTGETTPSTRTRTGRAKAAPTKGRARASLAKNIVIELRGVG